MRIAFLGTPDFAVPSLLALYNAGYDIAVFTQPDRPSGRGNKMLPPAVKAEALKLGLPVYQFEKIKSPEGVEALRQFAPELMVTAAFGQLLTQQVLDIPAYGCINVHGSLLPAYRGAAPIQWAIINGEKITGITTMFTDKGLDTGDMLLKKEVEILPEETAGELFARLAPIGAQLLIDTIDALLAGTLKREKQDENASSYYPMIKKQDGQMDFTKDAQSLHNFVRGMNPWPGAFAVLEEGTVKILKATPCMGTGQCGEVLQADARNGLVFACNGGALSADIIQFAGSKAMPACDYLRGHAIKKGQKAQ